MKTNADGPDIAIRLTQGANRDITVPITWVEVSIKKHALGACLPQLGVTPPNTSTNWMRQSSFVPNFLEHWWAERVLD
jgi:hypothetical protein